MVDPVGQSFHMEWEQIGLLFLACPMLRCQSIADQMYYDEENTGRDPNIENNCFQKLLL
jgi:hypothetical protein